jgi:hypothetical protein
MFTSQHLKFIVILMNATLLCGIVYCGRANAMLLKMGKDELAVKADRIVVGKVTAIEARLSEGEGLIYSSVKIAVEDNIKGAGAEGTISVRVAGGTVGGEGMETESAPKFKVGEKVVLFLEKGPDEEWLVIGGFQGKYTVLGDKVLKEEMPVGDFKGAIHKILERGK